MNNFRLLNTGFKTGFYNMGLDEALLESVAAGGTPVLRLYGWKPPCVSIGYFQGLDDEVDRAACGREGVDITRRISGGGAVFHDAEITYSLIMSAAHPLAAGNINASYEKLCSGVIKGLALLGLEAAFVPINDIIAGGKKVSGNAQTRRSGCVLQHGTVLLSLNPEKMFRLLKVPKEKLAGKLIEDIKSRVAGLGELLRRPVPFTEAENALAQGFREALELDYISTEKKPAESENRRAITLAREKFGNDRWVFKR